jgi:putative membrane protein
MFCATAILVSASVTFVPGRLMGQVVPGAAAGSQQQQQQQQQQQNNELGMNGGLGATAASEQQDQDFLKHAAEGGMAEVQLGQLAAQKGGSDAVKQFGQKMVDGHTTLNDQMKALGAKAPKHLSKADQSEYDKLSALSGDAFDKEYIAYMVKAHRKDLRDFKYEEESTANAPLKMAVAKGEQMIQDHLAMADQIAKDQKGYRGAKAATQGDGRRGTCAYGEAGNRQARWRVE